MRLNDVVTFFFILIFSASVFAAEKNLPLPAEQAFTLSISIKNPKEIIAEWHIAPGYYLYRDRIYFTFQPNVASDIRFPQGDLQYSADRGRYEVYSGNVMIPIFLNTKATSVQLSVNYQGCSSDKFCYPPMKRNITLNLQNQSTQLMNHQPSSPAFSWRSLLTDQNGVQALLNAQNVAVLLFVFLVLGLFLAFTPCVLPMVPILASIIIGQEKINTTKAFFLSLSYVLGMAITYALAGVAAAVVGSTIQVWLQKPIFILAGSGLFVLLALSLFGFYNLRLPHSVHNKITHWSNQYTGGTYVGVFFMGVLSTLIVSPCVTAPLVGILLYMGQTGDALFGASALFMMGVGMGIPLMVVGLSAGKYLPKSGYWMDVIKKMFGLMMLLVAVWMLSRVTAITTKLQPFIPFNVSSTSIMDNQFVVVHDAKEMWKQLSLAKMARKPVIIDFYADWCESCVVMDKNVFSKTDVKQLLGHFILLRADLSDNTVDDEALLKNFNVIAPPTVLFFNQQGEEIFSHRIVGEVDKQEFLTRIHKFITADYCDKKITC